MRASLGAETAPRRMTTGGPDSPMIGGVFDGGGGLNETGGDGAVGAVA